MLIYKLSCVFSNYQYFSKFCESFSIFSILVCRAIEMLNEEPMSIIAQSFVSSAFTEAG